MKKTCIIFLFCSILISTSAIAGIPQFDWIKEVGAKHFPASGDRVYLVSDYGAVGDAVTLCTESIQRTIDTCAAQGGGTVTFGPGIYLTGSIFLKSNVILDIPKGTQLIGSQNLKDYKLLPQTRVAGITISWPAALINVVGQKNVAITGDGVIHGRGKVFWDSYRTLRQEYDPKGLRWIVDYDCQRPRGILISESKDITLRDFVLYQAGFWSVHILYSDQVTVDGLIISNNIEGRGPSTDGIDIDSSTRILVENCYVNCNDDNFCLKAGRDADGLRINRPCEYVVIRNCEAGYGDGLFTCGSETSGCIRNIVAYNLRGKGTKYGLRFKSAYNRGGVVEDIYLNDIEMIGVRDPIVVDLNWLPAYNDKRLPSGYDYDSLPPHWKSMLEEVPSHLAMPKFRNIFFENVTADRARIGITVHGLPESTVDEFHLKNVTLQAEIPGIMKHARNWHFDNVRITGNLKPEIEISECTGIPLKEINK